MQEQEPQQQEGDHRGETPQAGASPEIYVASLSDYNEGHLHGVWLDATLPMEELEMRIAGMLSRSPIQGAEEWAIHDYDDFAGIRIGEHEDLGYVSLLAGLLQRHGPAFAAWVDICGDPQLLESFGQAYIGHYDTLAAYGAQLVDELGYAEELAKVLPAGIAPYVRIDDEAIARDLWMNGDISYTQAAEGGIWIFDGHF